LTDLGNFGGGVSMGFGINAGGEIVGRSYTNIQLHFRCGRHICTKTVHHAFRWSAGTMTDLTPGPPPPATQDFSEALAINRSGEIVGFDNSGGFVLHNGQRTSLPGRPFAINDLGEVAGNGGSSGGAHAFLFSGGKTTVLPDLSTYGGGLSSATGINNHHQVVGSSDNAEGWGHAVMWSNGKVQDLGTLGGTQSAAYAINDLGEVVGWAHTASEATHVFRFSAGTTHDLGTFGLDPVALAINNHGVIVGISGRGAFVWSNGAFYELNALIPPGSGFVLTEATAINDAGQIVANGHSTTNYQTHAFLLSPG
jgi:probable HAF family extracellular repeat protein